MSPKLFYTALCYFFAGALLWSQKTGKIEYEQLGISMEVPTGWVAQEGDGFLLIGSQTVPGFIMLTTHNYDIEQLRSEAISGMQFDQGSSLFLSEDLRNIAPKAISGIFSGIMEYQSVKAYIIGVENPYEGVGVTIMAATQPQLFSSIHTEVADKIYASLAFKKVDRENEFNQWKKFLSNVKLTYMDSYYSSSYTSGGVSGGYSSQRVIDICERGFFRYNSSSNVSASGSGISGYDTGGSAGDGSWTIGIGSDGSTNLILNFNNGEQYSYSLEYREEKLYLNGDRFFRTTSGEYAPNCY